MWHFQFIWQWSKFQFVFQKRPKLLFIIHSWICSCLTCNIHILFNHISQCKVNNGEKIELGPYFKFANECQQFPHFVMKVEWIQTCWDNYGLRLGFSWGQKDIPKFDLHVKNRSWKHLTTHLNFFVCMFNHKFLAFLFFCMKIYELERFEGDVPSKLVERLFCKA
jgi:hypothetical protein